MKNIRNSLLRKVLRNCFCERFQPNHIKVHSWPIYHNIENQYILLCRVTQDRCWLVKNVGKYNVALAGFYSSFSHFANNIFSECRVIGSRRRVDFFSTLHSSFFYIIYSAAVSKIKVYKMCWTYETIESLFNYLIKFLNKIFFILVENPKIIWIKRYLF